MIKMSLDHNSELMKKLLVNVAPTSPAVKEGLLQWNIYLKKAILQGLQSGTEIDGTPFVEYSTKYAAFRKANSKSTKVDLMFSARMWNSFGGYISAPGVLEFGAGLGGQIRTHYELAMKHDKGLGVPKREFIGFRKFMIEYFQNKIVPFIAKQALSGL